MSSALIIISSTLEDWSEWGDLTSQLLAPKASRLPLAYIPEWRSQQGSNLQHPDYRSGALPIELCDHNNGLISKPYLLYHKSCFLSICFQDFKIQAIESLLSMFYWYLVDLTGFEPARCFQPEIFLLLYVTIAA